MTSDSAFAGKRVLITGATQGIGLATAQRLIQSGAHLFVNDINEDRLASALGFLPSTSRQVGGMAGSVAKTADCRTLVAAAAAHMDGIDILINCAGVYRQGPADSFDEDEWDDTLGVNLKGTFFMSKYALPHLKKRRGNIINLASEAGLRGARMSAVYCASKGGVVLLTKAMALEYAPDVRINCVCPGAVNTPMMTNVAKASGDAESYMAALPLHYPLQRIAEPDEIAKAICYLASDDACNMTGTALAIDGGSTAGV